MKLWKQFDRREHYIRGNKEEKLAKDYEGDNMTCCITTTKACSVVVAKMKQRV